MWRRAEVLAAVVVFLDARCGVPVKIHRGRQHPPHGCDKRRLGPLTRHARESGPALAAIATELPRTGRAGPGPGQHAPSAGRPVKPQQQNATSARHRHPGPRLTNAPYRADGVRVQQAGQSRSVTSPRTVLGKRRVLCSGSFVANVDGFVQILRRGSVRKGGSRSDAPQPVADLDFACSV